MSTEFETPDVDVTIYDKGLFATGEIGSVQNITLKWSLDLEMRSWGVKNVYAHVPDQKVVFLYDRFDEATDEYVTEEKEVLLQNVQVDLDDTGWDSGLAPTSLSFYRGIWTVAFGRMG